MLDDQLTLLDGTEVVSTSGAARLGLEDALHELYGPSHVATLDGVRYYSLEDLRAFVAGSW